MPNLKITLVAALALFTGCASSLSGGDTERVDAGNRSVDASPGTPAPDSSVPIPVELALRLAPTSLTLGVGESAEIVGTPSENMVEVNRQILWESSDPTIASVDNSGQVTGNSPGSTVISATIDQSSVTETASVTVTAASCIDGMGNNNDSCAAIYQGVDIWRCTVSSNQSGNVVSQVCRDTGGGAKWITFNVNPIDCCTCMGSMSSPGCCALNSGSSGC